MHDDDHKPGKELRLPQSNLPATLATSKKLVQHLKTALANSRRDLVAEDDGWVERLIRGLEEKTIIWARIETEDGEEEFDSPLEEKFDYSLWEWNRETWLAITGLQFSKCGSTLPIGINQLHNLRELDLSGNKLTALPAEVGKLHNLLLFFLNGNQLTTLPAEMGQLHHLQELYLGWNQLLTLPAEMGQLRNLQVLYLNDNQLTTLPAEIGQLQNLRYLDLDKNPLRSLPASLKHLYRKHNSKLEIKLDNPALLND